MDEFLKFIVKNNLTPDQIFVLHSLHTGVQYELDYSNIGTLLVHDYVYVSGSEYKISPKGNLLLLQAEKFLSSIRKTKPLKQDINIWNNELSLYVSLFPKGFQGSQPIRTNTKDLVDRFVWFFDRYNYNWEVVLKATDKYVQSCEKDSYRYIMTAKNFVKKEERAGKVTISSPLSGWCEAYVQGDFDISAGNKYFGDKIV